MDVDNEPSTSQGSQPAAQPPTNSVLQEYPPIVIPPLPDPVQSLDASGPRLIISKIVIENFKSYGAKRVLGPFHKNFTCIIGPNGSGKSNVIDSLLFVFGYRASKIRSKKLSVLIHNSEILSNMPSCTVEVHFQKIVDTGSEADEYTVVPNSELIVSRTAFRDNSSYYQVNGRRVGHKEVAILLKAQGIDLDHNRFLILQGEVEQIALMKPKAPTEHEDGLLEYLEDIIGSSRFKQPLDTLVQRIEDLNEMRQEKLNRVKAVEREKVALEGVRNEALDYLRLCNEVVKSKNILYQMHLLECREKGEEVTAQLQEAEAVHQASLARVGEVAGRKKSKIAEHAVILGRYENLQKVYQSSKERFAELEAEDGRLRDEHKHMKATGKRLVRQLELEKKKMEELESAPEEARARIDELNGKLAKLDKEKVKEEENYRKAMESLQDETRDLQKAKEKEELALNTVQKEADEKRSVLELAKSELSLLTSGYNREKAKLDNIEATRNQVRSTLNERKKSLAALETELPKMKLSAERTRKDLDSVRGKEQSLSEEVRVMRSKLEESRSAYQADYSQNRVLHALMEQKQKGNIPGIIGRLGDLGAIPDRYDVAISTACGALDNIVTDTIDTAQRCVQFLKQHEVGQATFIGLDKMEKFRVQANQRIQTPENTPRLFDLVQVANEAVKPAFYYALRDTLVADNLDQATRIAYGRTRYRVVTLQGQLIETSGAMTGGGGRVMSGRMSSDLRRAKAVAGQPEFSPAQLDKMEKEVSGKVVELDKIRSARLKMEETLARVEKDAREGQRSWDNFQAESGRLENQLAALEEQIKSAEARLKSACPDPAKLTQMESRVAELTTQHSEVAASAAEWKQKVDRLHNQIMEVGSVKLGAVQGRLDAVKKSIQQVTEQVNKINVSVRTAERNLNKCREHCVNLEQEITDTQEKIKQLTETMTTMEKDAADMMAKFNKAQEEVDQLQKVVQSLKAEIAVFEAEEVECQKAEVAANRTLTTAKDKLDEYTGRVRHWVAELERLKLHRIDEDEESLDQSRNSVGGVRGAPKLMTFTAEELKSKKMNPTMITELEDQVRAMKPNMAAIDEFRKKEEQYLFRVEELEQVTGVRDDQKRQLDQCRRQRLEEFMAGFHMITGKLKEMYQMITLGGDAELELVDSLDPFSEGIVFSVRPPKKSWKNISNLSGGEKTLSSLALVFALHHYKPTPLYVMDEIDAALDFKNVSIVANYVKQRTRNAQFIIISLRNNMYELGDRLVGIYKTSNITRSIVVDPAPLELILAGAVLRATGISNPAGAEKRSKPASAAPGSNVASQGAVCMALVPSQAATSQLPEQQQPTKTEPAGDAREVSLIDFDLDRPTRETKTEPAASVREASLIEVDLDIEPETTMELTEVERGDSSVPFDADLDRTLVAQIEPGEEIQLLEPVTAPLRRVTCGEGNSSLMEQD